MVIVTDFTYKLKNGNIHRGYYLDGGLKNVLDLVYDGVMEKSNNCLIVCDGDLGTSKSWSMVKVAHYFRWRSGKEFSLVYIVFSMEQFTELLPKLKPGDVVLFDEAALVAMSRDAMSQQNKQLMKIMMTLRSRQLFFIFCLPSFFDLDKTLALHRADMLIHMKSSSFGQRGVFSCYFKPKLKRLFINGKKTYSYPVRADLVGKFTAVFPLKEGYAAYENKKQEAVNQFARSPTKSGGNQWREQRNQLIVFLREEKKMQFKEIAAVIPGVKENSVGRLYKRIKDRENQDKKALDTPDFTNSDV